MFLLQDSRTYTGGDLMFWAAGGKGYTTDVGRAQSYSKEEAMRLHAIRPTDIPWPKAYLEARSQPAVDMQYLDPSRALTVAA